MDEKIKHQEQHEKRILKLQKFYRRAERALRKRGFDPVKINCYKADKILQKLGLKKGLTIDNHN